jgi:hypothetical protein
MSRNLSSTVCYNCSTDFMSRFIKPNDPSLLTEEEYFRAIGWWPNPYTNNQGHGWVHSSRAIHKSARFSRQDCPVCHAPFAGWYQLESTTQHREDAGPPEDMWVLFDSSYWFAFNDEPGMKDSELMRPVTMCVACSGHGMVPAAISVYACPHCKGCVPWFMKCNYCGLSGGDTGVGR